MKAFKAYDIRGEWGSDLNEDIAYRIGLFFNSCFNISSARWPRHAPLIPIPV